MFSVLMLINSIAKLNYNINLQWKYNSVNNIQMYKISQIPALSQVEIVKCKLHTLVMLECYYW